LEIDLSDRFRRDVRQLPKSRRRDVGRVIDALQDGFGKPHLHSGLGIRRLYRNYYECRAGLGLRLIFRAERGRITLFAAADHNQVRALLKNL
jgi:mRNA-degrading endonuclease RelE of RelBE toxin-antitoxin system